ncbi:MAG: cache domain-containing protein, partial [Xanthobacteraceae bacterium]
MTEWVKSIRQTTTYFGLAVIVVIWSGVFFLGRQEHARAYDEAVRQGNNLTLVLEEYVQRVILQSDNVLLALRRDYQRDPEHFDLVSWAKDTQFHKSLTANIGITDANGYVILSSLRYLPSPVYVGERPPFLFQRASSSSDRLFISDPVVGGVSKEPSIQFTRPINGPSGQFTGTVALALNIAELEKFFGSLDLGHAGIVSLVHSNGVVLVRDGSSPRAKEFIGTKLDSSPLFAELRKSSSGSYWNTT